LLAASTLLALVLAQVLFRPVVALANNGDFDRLLAMVGLRSTGPGFALPFAWLHYTVGHTHAPGGTYITSYLGMAWLMSALAHLLPGGHFDSRILAAVLAVLLAAVVYLLVKSIPGQVARLGAGIVLVIGLSDSRLVAYLDSWYDEPWSLLLLLGLTTWLLHNRGKRAVPRRSLIVPMALSVLLITTKSQDAMLVVPIAGTIIVLSRAGGQRSLAHRLLVGAVPCLFLLATAVTFVASQSAVYASESRYDLIFDDVLIHVHDPADTLRSLGLPTYMTVYAGSNAYQTGTGYHTPAYQRFDAGDPAERLALYFVTHPAVAAEAVGRGQQAGWQAHLPYLGYRTYAPGTAWADACEPCAYSTAAATASGGGVPLTIALYGAALLLAALARRRSRAGIADALVWLCAISATALLTGVFGEGRYEEVKHLYLFYISNLLLLSLGFVASLDLIQQRMLASMPNPPRSGQIHTDSKRRDAQAPRAPSDMPNVRYGAPIADSRAPCGSTHPGPRPPKMECYVAGVADLPLTIGP
jgi:hypothetical protein